MPDHPAHPDIIKRLKRAEGHLSSIIAMLEDGRGCLEITQQIHAVEKAVANAKKILIHEHIDHCISHASRKDAHAADAALKEFQEITKYL